MTTPGGSLGLKGAAAPAYRLAVHVAGIEPGLQQGEQAAKGIWPCCPRALPMRCRLLSAIQCGGNGPGLSHNNPCRISHLSQIAQIGFRLCVIM